LLWLKKKWKERKESKCGEKQNKQSIQKYCFGLLHSKLNCLLIVSTSIRSPNFPVFSSLSPRKKIINLATTLIHKNIYLIIRAPSPDSRSTFHSCLRCSEESLQMDSLCLPANVDCPCSFCSDTVSSWRRRRRTDKQTRSECQSVWCRECLQIKLNQSQLAELNICERCVSLCNRRESGIERSISWRPHHHAGWLRVSMWILGAA
jgi:hypothetical protein